MALIKCTECGKDISDKAAACPNCGCPTEEILAVLEEKAKMETQRAKLQADKLNEEKIKLENEKKELAIILEKLK